MLTIALTGGIGSGKSTITTLFAKLGAPFCDADDISRELTQAGSPTLLEISDLFGQDILNDNGQLDRRRLREIIFSDLQKRQQLEAILHPRINHQVECWIQQQTADYGIISIPLLAENLRRYQLDGQFAKQLDRVLVVELDPSTQRQRTAKRDNAEEASIQAIITAQASAEQRRAIADDIVDNNGDINALKRQVMQLHEKYRGLALSRS